MVHMYFLHEPLRGREAAVIGGLASATVPHFPFQLLPGEQEPPREIRYRIRTFLEGMSDGWWNVNVSESRPPNLDEIMKTLEPEAIQRGLAKLPGLVEDAFRPPGS